MFYKYFFKKFARGKSLNIHCFFKVFFKIFEENGTKSDKRFIFSYPKFSKVRGNGRP